MRKKKMSDELAFSRNVEILENILGAEHVLPEPEGTCGNNPSGDSES